MTWEYGDYITIDNKQARRKRLQLHIQEVAQAMSGFQSRNTGDGWSYSKFGSLQNYYESLLKQYASLNSELGRNRRAGFVACY